MQFDHFAQCYSQNAFIQKDLIAWGAPFLDIIPLNNKSVIELGAGTGLLTQYLLKNNPKCLLATDKSPQMILEGKQQVPEAQWQLMDAWNMPIQPFDHIFSSSLLQWAPHPEQVIANWTKNLKKGGTIHALFFIDQTLIELRQLVSLEKTLQWRTSDNWQTIFKNNDLKLRLCRNLTKSYQFQGALDLLKNLKQTGTSLKNHLCGSHLKKIINDYDGRFRLKENIGIHSTWHFCQIVAVK